MDPWKLALSRVVETAYDTMERDFGGRWCLIGSAATALQGIDIVPRDLDILAREPEAVLRFAKLMADFAPEANPYPDGMENWLSSTRRPVKMDEPNPDEFVWHFGRWMVSGVKSEIAHIVPPVGMRLDDGIWEAGPAMWPHVKRMKFLDWELPVVPLEIQLQTNLGRKLDDRVKKILARLNEVGCDSELLDIALSEANKERLGNLTGHNND